MTFEEFSVSVDAAVPNHKPEALLGWRDFATECVENGQFVHFEAMEDTAAAAEKWLDVLRNGIFAVKHSFGEDIATALVNLSCEGGCLYPDEMMQAAVCLSVGCTGKEIFDLIESGDIDSDDLFSPVSREKAMGIAETAKLMKRRSSVLMRLNRTGKAVEPSKNKTNVERGMER